MVLVHKEYLSLIKTPLKHGSYYMRLLLCILVLGGLLFAGPSYADPAAAPTCTDNNSTFNIPPIPDGQGLLSTIVKDIQTILFGNPSVGIPGIAQNMYNTIVKDTGFKDAIAALLTLYIAIYGILFMLGMTGQLTLYDFGIRMIKVGLIIILISDDSWDFFSKYVVTFFNQGTDEIINNVTNIAVGGITNNINPAPGGNPYPFAALDSVIAKALSAKMWVTVLAIVFTGPYGLLYGLLIGLALRALIAALLTAMWVYLMSLIIRTLLFGIAPVFIACILFGRTRHLFDGWLNQLVNSCLQPIFLFVFFAFFVKLMEGSIDNIITYNSPAKPPPVCWTEPGEVMRGTPQKKFWWRFSVWNPNATCLVYPANGVGPPVTQTGCYQPYSDEWGWTGPVLPGVSSSPTQPSGSQGPPLFPLDLLNILIFFMLAELAGRFNTIVVQIAKDIAGASTDLSTMQGSLSEWFSPGGGDRKNNVLSQIGGRTGPPGSGRYAAKGAQTVSTSRVQGGAQTGFRPGGNG